MSAPPKQHFGDEDAASQLTLEEKVRFLTGLNGWQTVPLESVATRSLWLSDGPHGVRREVAPLTSLPATSFPTESALGATWNRALMEQVAAAIGREARAQGVDVLLGPGINMKRTPLCGRNFEYFAEDPFLTAELAIAYVRGVQSQGVGTSVKHFAANNQEDQRHSISAVVDERTLREIYLAAFERVVREADPWTIMCSYNRINGTFASENTWLLTEVLREEWGFTGVVISDWGAVHDRAAALQAGTDLEMPTSETGPQRLLSAIRDGQLSEDLVDQSVARLRALVRRADEANAQHATGATQEIPWEEHHALARRAAAEAMVLLRNENSVLPLRMSVGSTIALIGGFAAQPRIQGGGSAEVNPTMVDSARDLLEAALPEGVKVAYEMGFPSGDPEPGLDLAESHRRALQEAAQADVTLVFAGLPDRIESEGYDRRDLRLPPEQEQLIEEIAALGRPLIVVVTAGSAIDMSSWHDSVDAILWAWLPGQAGAGAIVDILLGEVSPSGRLSETFPMRLSDTPAFANYPGERGEVRYGEGTLIGYRWYDAHDLDVRYPFGHGLGYSRFEYADLDVAATVQKGSVTVSASVRITNVGGMTAQETVQLYVTDAHSPVRRAPRELRDFAKVSLEPGESTTVSFSLGERAFAWFDTRSRQWRRTEGTFLVHVGASSRDIRATQAIHLPGDTLTPPVLIGEELAEQIRTSPR